MTQETGDEQPETFDILLIEDNPGDARLIEEMLRDADDLAQWIDPDVGGERSTELHHRETLSAGMTSLQAAPVDVVLLDLNLPDSAGLDTLSTVVDVTDDTPIVVLTGLSDRGVGVEAIQRGAQDYLVKDEVTSSSITRAIHHAIERHQQERERERRRQELESLNRLNRISQDVTHAVINSSTRTELEQLVCDRLVESDAYRFAWIGEVERAGRRVVPRVAAGAGDGYLEEVTITIDESDTAEGPTGRAVKTRETQVVDDVRTNPAYGPWREQAIDRGYRSTIAVPIVHEDWRYGVISVYSATPEAFTESEVETLTGLGVIVGHAIAALERKEALVNDVVLELEYQVNEVAAPLVALSSTQECLARVDRLIRTSTESHLLFGTVRGLDPDEFREAVADLPMVEELHVNRPKSGEWHFELCTVGPVPLVDAVTTHDGRVESIVVADGELRVLVAVPHGTDTRRLTEAIQDRCAGAELVAQRTIDRDVDVRQDYHAVFEGELTEKQRMALETAYFAGYFDWPRTSTGEEIAERLGISPATFTEHLRAAERKFFDALFE